MSSRPPGSPPPYESDHEYPPPSQKAYSYYPDDEFQHFYRWSSPVGIIKIMAILVIIMCLAIFACVASTLAWDVQGALGGYGVGGGYGAGGYGAGGYGAGGYGGGYNSFGGSSYGAGSYYGAVGGNYNDPRTAKGFIIAMAGFIFIACLVVFIIIVSHQSLSDSRRFYLVLAIVSGVLAALMLIAAIVYLVAVNPMGQSNGSMYTMQIQGLCAQYQQPQNMGIMTNQYLYHYCVLEPQEAIAAVLGFLVAVALIVMLVFAVKTRRKIQTYGKSNILWKRVKVMDDMAPPPDVEEWVNNVATAPESVPIADYPEKLRGSRSYLDDEGSNYTKPPYSYTPQPAVENHQPLQNGVPYGPPSDVSSSVEKPKKKRAGRPRRTDGYDTDYNSSGDELDDNDFDSEFPPIKNEQERSDYKREFDLTHQEYKDLQAELDGVNKDLSDLDKQLDELEEGSPQFLDALDEYNRLKDLKKSADYQMKRRRCKYLKPKLNHIKKMVSDFDHRA
ncbi:occludin [Betta splendens]|uniref:Occludin n=1 Tax=Betta splendens TaxID=158456 RepID=A0A6P7P4R6_BETSP|nr:occludin [Betta splendens]